MSFLSHVKLCVRDVLIRSAPSRSIQAILLICFLSFDVLLDVFTLLRAQAPWPTWGLALRCVCGTAYIVLSLVSVGLGGVFPQGHTYWGMSADSASTAVYVLLCAEG